MDKPTIYVFCNTKCNGRGDWHSMVAVTEDGECLAGHICSSHVYAANDMGINEDGWKRDIYAKKYPDGFTVRWIEGDELAAKIPTWEAEQKKRESAESAS